MSATEYRHLLLRGRMAMVGIVVTAVVEAAVEEVAEVVVEVVVL